MNGYPDWIKDVPMEFWEDKAVLELVLKHKMIRLEKLEMATQEFKDQIGRHKRENDT